MPLDKWRQREPITATKLNQPVDAINHMATDATGDRRRGHGSVIRWGIIQSAEATGVNDANANPVQWIYTIHESTKNGTGYGAWETLPAGNGYRGNAYNPMEDQNTGLVKQGNGVDHDGADYPAGFEMQPLQSVFPYPFVLMPAFDGERFIDEAWILAIPNGEDGTCA